MTVYVDNYKGRYGRMIMCHMMADTDDELHSMAAKIGLSRIWFQDKTSFKHYDVSLSKKAQALKLGAVEITAKELVLKFRPTRPQGQEKEKRGGENPTT